MSVSIPTMLCCVCQEINYTPLTHTHTGAKREGRDVTKSCRNSPSLGSLDPKKFMTGGPRKTARQEGWFVSILHTLGLYIEMWKGQKRLTDQFKKQWQLQHKNRAYPPGLPVTNKKRSSRQPAQWGPPAVCVNVRRPNTLCVCVCVRVCVCDMWPLVSPRPFWPQIPAPTRNFPGCVCVCEHREGMWVLGGGLGGWGRGPDGQDWSGRASPAAPPLLVRPRPRCPARVSQQAPRGNRGGSYIYTYKYIFCVVWPQKIFRFASV